MKSILFLIQKYLTEPIQMELSQKQKTFLGTFLSFLKSLLNFNHSQKKGHFHRWRISEITDSQKCRKIIV